MRIIMRFPGGLAKTFTMSYDDGVWQDVELIRIMKKYGIKGTFNINSGRWDKNEKSPSPDKITYQKAKEIYLDNGMEIATHSVNHPYLEQLPSAAAAHEVLLDRISLEKNLGIIVRGHAYPYGSWSQDLIKTLRQCGIVYARTTVATGKFNLPETDEDWLAMPATAKHTDPKLFELGEKFLNSPSSARPMMFYLWGHSYEFDEAHDNNWELIDKFLEFIGNKDDIWYATNIEIYDYVHAFKRLEFSADCSRVYNPSNQTVWFMNDKSLVSVAPGETLDLSSN